MRTSILSRSAIIVASLAIGSAALVAAPATAAAPAGVTRDLVLTVADGLRTAAATHESPSPATREKLNLLISAACDLQVTGQNLVRYSTARPVVAGEADGVLVNANIGEFDTEGHETRRDCSFAALASADKDFELNGAISLSLGAYNRVEGVSVAPVTLPAIISGGVFVTAPYNLTSDFFLESSSMTAVGSATRSTTVSTPAKVTTPKSAAAKKSAKKKYDSAVKAAKKKYTKSGRTAKAKKAYNRKVAAAKATYKKAVAPTTKTVNKVTTTTVNRPFAVSAQLDLD